MTIPFSTLCPPEDCNHEGGTAALEITVDGLLGGHSGLNIGDGRANAICLAVGAAQAVLDASAGAARLVVFRGGDKRNAIPRQATAVLAVPRSQVHAALAAVDDAAAVMRKEYSNEPSASIQGVEVAADVLQKGVADRETTLRALDVLATVPHGAEKYSNDVAGLVETSNNLASVTTEYGYLQVLCTTRSFLPAGVDRVRNRLRAIATTMGRGNVEQPPAYPGWQPNTNSRILTLTKDILGEVLKEEAAKENAEAPDPQVLAIHAGLECGVIGEKCDAIQGKGAKPMDMVSFGPTIRGAHSPEERVDVTTVAPFFALTKRVLAALAEG